MPLRGSLLLQDNQKCREIGFRLYTIILRKALQKVARNVLLVSLCLILRFRMEYDLKRKEYM